MVKLTIDGVTVEVAEGTKIIAAAEAAGVKIPTLCAFPGLNEIGACRVCVVEVEGQERLVAACNMEVADGMVVRTNTPKVRRARKTNVELILSQHKSQCTSCVRSGNCTLQSLANDLNIIDPRFKGMPAREPWVPGFPLVRDASKCVKCYRCVQVCDDVQAIHVWDLKNSGTRAGVGVTGGLSIDATKCALCGQCITHCPVGALRERDDTDRVLDALADPEITTVVQVAPAVRAAWGEQLGLTREEATPGRMVNALRRLGFDYVFDTDFTADLTIMEEANELLERLKEADKYTFPMFTSCCPGWIRYMKGHHPDMIPQLSTSKSPQQMFGSAVKALFEKTKGLDPKKVFCVSVMPCVAKKYEAGVEAMYDACETGDVDCSITTREFVRLLKSDFVNPAELVEDAFDSPMGASTGAAVIFGATGGVMEAALRTAYFAVMGENPDPDAFSCVRGLDGWRDYTFNLAGTELKIAVASGLGNASKLIDALNAGEVSYHFVEIMACPGGCAGGGGQPIHDGCELAGTRGQNLYALDKAADLRFSHENPEVIAIYDNLFEYPLSELAEELLHTDQAEWKF